MNRFSLLIVAALALLAWQAPAVEKWEKTIAAAHFTNFVEGFDEVRLERNENRAELQWFLEQVQNGGTFTRNEFNNDKQSMKRRLAALYVLCKGWAELSERFLAKAEKSRTQELATFAERLRTYVGRPALKVELKKFDASQAEATLKDFAGAFNAFKLVTNESRGEVAWFGAEGPDAYSFLENYIHAEKQPMKVRQSALFLLMKFWPVRGHGELARAEKSSTVDLAQFAKRVRDHYQVPVIKPKVP